MNWLLWKEYRVNRVIVIVGAGILVVPHMVALLVAWWRVAHGIGGPAEEQLPVCLYLSSVYSMIFSQLTLCLLGGHAIAGERADRSAEFLASLPISRTRTVAGKLGLALLAAVLIWVPNLLISQLVTLGASGGASLEIATIRETQHLTAGAAAVGFLFFSVAWLFSSMWESSTFAICMGLITPYALLLIVGAAAWMFEYNIEILVQHWYWGLCLALAPVCLVSGTWYYLRRVEP